MTIEQQLRDLFAADAAAAPSADRLLDGTLRRVRRRRVRTAWGGGAAVGVLATVLALAVTFQTPAREPDIAWPTAAGTVPAGKAGQPLAGNALASCVTEYSPAEVARRDVAFDGTVVGIGPAVTNREREGALSGLVGVTLQVNRWFKGGEVDTVVVDMPAPAEDGGGVHRRAGAPEYGVGTRLLVSGASRWGSSDPLSDVIAWDCGGFTRYFSPDVAAQWAAATG